jgi:hypothetical protein
MIAVAVVAAIIASVQFAQRSRRFQRLAKLHQAQANAFAATAAVLPFAPSPMAGRHPETEGRASSRKSVLLEKKLKARTSSTINQPCEHLKPSVADPGSV